MADFSLSVGPMLLGALLNTYLYGVVCVQFISYAEHKFNDTLATRATVAALFCVDTVHSAVVVYAAWDICVTNYNNPADLALTHWAISFAAFATCIVAFITQLFLGLRVLKLSKSRLLTTVIWAFSLVSLALGFVVGIRVAEIRLIAEYNERKLPIFVIGWLVSQMVADLMITGSLLYYLNTMRTGFHQSQQVQILHRLMRGAIQTGLFASLFAMADLVSFLLLTESALYTLFALPLGRIYTNTLLETLNNRPKPQKSTANSTSGHSIHAIHIHTEIHTSVEDGVDVKRDRLEDGDAGMLRSHAE